MLSVGVMAPESTISGSSTRITSRPNCGMLRAMVPRKMPSEVVENRYSRVPAANSRIEPLTCTPSTPRTITSSANRPPQSTTTLMLHTLLSMISSGVTGITSRCSMVPCSRSRIRAAPASTMDSTVRLLMMLVMPPNHEAYRFGLNLTWVTRRAGSGRSLLRWPLIQASTSEARMFSM